VPPNAPCNAPPTPPHRTLHRTLGALSIAPSVHPQTRPKRAPKRTLNTVKHGQYKDKQLFFFLYCLNTKHKLRALSPPLATHHHLPLILCTVAHPSAHRPTPLCASPRAHLHVTPRPSARRRTWAASLHAPLRVIARHTSLCVVAYAPLRVALGCDVLSSHAPPARGRDCDIWARVNAHPRLGRGQPRTRVWGEGERVLASGARVKPYALAFGARARARAAVRVPPLCAQCVVL